MQIVTKFLFCLCGCFSQKVFPFFPFSQRVLYFFKRVTRGGDGERGGGGGLTCPFLKLKEKCPDFGKTNAPARFIYGLNFSFKMLF